MDAVEVQEVNNIKNTVKAKEINTKYQMSAQLIEIAKLYDKRKG
jgi:hypothetical protein